MTHLPKNYDRLLTNSSAAFEFIEGMMGGLLRKEVSSTIYLGVFYPEFLLDEFEDSDFDLIKRELNERELGR